MRYLITGGAGFFGRAFARHALDVNPKNVVCIYSRDEAKHAAMRDEFNDDPRLRWFIGDVRDGERLRRAFEGVQCVVHAAALKRIETGTYNPDEFIKTNINGTMNVIEAAHKAKVPKVVGLSTDKAWGGGVSPYGQTKALVESLLINANNMGKTKFAAVRYGNIWRSTGSIVPRWEALKIVAEVTEVPVTDPDCTRFFMLKQQAVDLVMETVEKMKGGELVIPETLPAYRVGDLAEAMGMKMRVVGLPKWERKHEGMRDGLTSDIARRMSVEELRQALKLF